MADPLGAELTTDEVKSLAASGAAVLLLREGVIRAVNVLGGIALARILAPEVFGVFAIVTFILYFFTLFRDLGLGGAVIQKGERLSDDDLATVFTLQQAAATLLALGAALSAPIVVDMYRLDPAAAWLVRALAMAFFLGSFGTVPALLLERRLAFDRLVAVELAGTVTYFISAVSLAFTGRGVWSLVAAVLARSMVTLAAVYVASPWMPRIRVAPRAAREMLGYGLPFQASLVVHFVKDNVAPTLVAMLAGAQAVGYVNWATSVAFLPLLFVGVAGRVTFPAYSRLQHDRELLGKAVEKSIRLVCLGVFPSVFLMVALAPGIVQFVYTEKWEPALPAFYLFCVCTMGAAIATTASNAVYAMGKAVAMLRVVAICTVVLWGASLLLVPAFQFTGYALANAIVTITVAFFLPIRELRKIVDVKLLPSIWSPLVAGVVAGGLAYVSSRVLVRDFVSLLGVGLGGGAAYLGCLLLIDGRRLKAEFQDGLDMVLRRGTAQ